MDDGFSLGPALLFCPANRPERFAKAASRADATILDLEDAVPPAEKAKARQAIVDSGLDPQRTLVRVNTGSKAELQKDLEALARTDYRYLVAGKCESVADVEPLGSYRVIVQCETPRGYLALRSLAELENVVALFWGSEDLAELVGGTSSRKPDGSYTDVVRTVRSTVLLTAAAYGKVAVDAIHADIADLEGLRTEAEEAARSGFTASACIHPGQVAVIRDAYRPSEEAHGRARRIVSAAEAQEGDGAFRLDDEMIDGPIVAQARRILARAAN